MPHGRPRVPTSNASLCVHLVPEQGVGLAFSQVGTPLMSLSIGDVSASGPFFTCHACAQLCRSSQAAVVANVGNLRDLQSIEKNSLPTFPHGLLLTVG